MAKNTNLHSAKENKNDEFYTRLTDIEKELVHYRAHFKGMTVLCNCGDAMHHNFGKYFAANFEKLGLKKLMCTTFNMDGSPAKVASYYGDKNGNRVPDPDEWEITELKGNGDFRSDEVVELLKQSDIVVSNPPFSLFRDYVKQLMDYNKKFLIIGNNNAITYKEIFPLIKDNKMWLGCVNPKAYITTLKAVENEKTQYMEDGIVYQKFGNHCWFTNLTHNKRNEVFELTKKYSNECYPKYDNYEAIEVSKVVDIPMDYNGVMGVPITFLDKYNPSQFEIIKFRKGDDDKDLSVNGKCPYFRILIRHKR